MIQQVHNPFKRVHVEIEKKSGITKNYIISLSQLWCDRMWLMRKKIMNSCVSDKQLLTVYHIKILVKSYKIFYDLEPFGGIMAFQVQTYY